MYAYVKCLINDDAQLLCAFTYLSVVFATCPSVDHFMKTEKLSFEICYAHSLCVYYVEIENVCKLLLLIWGLANHACIANMIITLNKNK